MELYLRISLLFIASVIIFFILFDSWRRRHHRKALHDSYLSQEQGDNEILFDSSDLIEDEGDGPIISGLTNNLQYSETRPVIKVPKNNSDDFSRQLIVISVVAKPDTRFESYDLLQAISATGMQFGEMNIFHYHYHDEIINKKIALFSLASATKPGEFDLDNMGNFSCKGLTLFMDMSKSDNPLHVFELMLKVADQLAEDLNGDLYAGYRQRLNPEQIENYRQQIVAYQNV